MRKIPAPLRRIGADCSIACATAGSELNVAVSAPRSPSAGFVSQRMRSGRSPRARKTAMSNPHRQNQRLAFAETVPRTSALMTALSMLLMVSKRLNPTIVSMLEKRSIE